MGRKNGSCFRHPSLDFQRNQQGRGWPGLWSGWDGRRNTHCSPGSVLSWINSHDKIIFKCFYSLQIVQPNILLILYAIEQIPRTRQPPQSQARQSKQKYISRTSGRTFQQYSFKRWATNEEKYGIWCSENPLQSNTFSRKVRRIGIDENFETELPRSMENWFFLYKPTERSGQDLLNGTHRIISEKDECQRNDDPRWIAHRRRPLDEEEKRRKLPHYVIFLPINR